MVWVLLLAVSVGVSMLGVPLMLFMAGGLWRLSALVLTVFMGVLVWYFCVDLLRPAVREERLRVGAEGLEHVEVRSRGADRVRRLPWAALVSVRLDDAGEQVLVRTTAGETVVARLGSREQRATIASALRDRLRRAGAEIPPRLPPGWLLRQPVRLHRASEAAQERVGAVVHRGGGRVLATTVQGLFATALLALPVLFLLRPVMSRWHLGPAGGYLLSVAVLGGGWLVYQVLWCRNRAPALELAPGWLAFGVIHPRTGIWHKPPRRVVGLHLSGSPAGDDEAAKYTLAAVLSSGGHATIDQRDGDDGLREVAAWLSEVTGVGVEDAI
jgi:hypothetical protein